MSEYRLSDIPADGTMASKEDGSFFSPTEVIGLANNGRTEESPEETILLPYKPGVPRGQADREMTFGRLFDSGSKYHVEQDEILDGFFDAPGRKLSKAGQIIGELKPGKPRYMEQAQRPAIDYEKVIKSPCCGSNMQYLNRTRARCSACGVEYQDNYA